MFDAVAGIRRRPSPGIARSLVGTVRTQMRRREREETEAAQPPPERASQSAASGFKFSRRHSMYPVDPTDNATEVVQNRSLAIELEAAGGVQLLLQLPRTVDFDEAESLRDEIKDRVELLRYSALTRNQMRAFLNS